MTREDIECIIKWFSHIEQLATDGKTANGYQMPTDKLLATIKVVAKDSREYVEKFCNESTANGLEEAAKQFVGYDMDRDDLRDYEIGIAAFKAGAKWQAEQGLTQVCRVKADYDSHGADYGVRFLRIEMPDDTPVGEKFIVKIIPKNL